MLNYLYNLIILIGYYIVYTLRFINFILIYYTKKIFFNWVLFYNIFIFSLTNNLRLAIKP